MRLCSAEHGIQNLTRRRLKISEINKLNDPFELVGVTSKYPEARRAFEVMKHETSSKRGIVCFSERWRNPVLWSHYADRHQGVALGFDVPAHVLAKVTYSAKRLDADSGLLGRDDDTSLAFMQRALTTKFSHWRYEREWRAFATLEEKCPDTGLYFMGFGDLLTLREVIVGHSSPISRANLARALGEQSSDVVVTKARLAFRSFDVVVQRKAALWS